jgi:putative membrane protein
LPKRASGGDCKDFAATQASVSLDGFTTPVMISLGGALVISILLIAAQQRGFGLLERLAHRLARRWAALAAAGAAAIQAAIGAIYRRRGGLLAGFAPHLICWILGAVEPWLALRWMGAPLGFEAVLAIESLLYAVRSVGFAIPDALGIQEGAYILLCGLFGIAPEVALSLSLLKRARDLSLGVPALLTWQLMETGRAWRRRADPVEHAAAPLRPPARP